MKVDINIGHTGLLNVVYWFASLTTAMVGHTIHGSFGWAFVNFWFWPLAWAKWLVCKEVNLSIVKATFAFLGE